MNIVCDPTKHDDLFPKSVKLQSWLSAKWNFAECQERPFIVVALQKAELILLIRDCSSLQLPNNVGIAIINHPTNHHKWVV